MSDDTLKAFPGFCVYGLDVDGVPDVGVCIELCGKLQWIGWQETLQLRDWLNGLVEAVK